MQSSETRLHWQVPITTQEQAEKTIRQQATKAGRRWREWQVRWLQERQHSQEESKAKWPQQDLQDPFLKCFACRTSTPSQSEIFFGGCWSAE
ncbi:MAG: hypothetical protein MJE68_26005 [Proteobacteria bacterium]|nr:hypothetical protein [Pseudomonadota bacterium]